jgi:hypothetical protein
MPRRVTLFFVWFSLTAGLCVHVGIVGWASDKRSTPAESPRKAGAVGSRKKGEGREESSPSIGGDRAADAKATGKIAGVVMFKGKPPDIKPLIVKKGHPDGGFCGHEVPNESLILGPDRELANAVLSVKVKTSKRPKPREIELTNDKCRFVPHVQATTRGSVIKVKTKDGGILHSAHAYGAANFNVAISDPASVIRKRLRRPGWVIMKCDYHDWMGAHIQVFPHDFFAVTGKDGKFEIVGIPPGEYEFEAWHERLKAGKQKVKVEAGKTAKLKIELSPHEE